MATSMADVVQPFNYCIIDEVDSILIDEANSADHLWAGGTTDGKYLQAAQVATALKKEDHYEVDERLVTCFCLMKALAKNNC